ncbi:Toxin HigB-2 [compost metagenome]
MVKVAKYVQLAYGFSMEAIFFETSFFTATVSDYLSDDEYKELQQVLLKNPECGDVMPRTGGFRKLRWGDRRRGKGKRGGLRVIYYWLSSDGQMWMFAIYDKDELENLTCDQERALKQAITVEVEARKTKRSVKQRSK